MSPFFAGLLMIAFGLLGTFFGYRIFRIILPIYGAIAGFLIAQALFPGSAFLALIVGIALAVVLAIIAYAAWSVFIAIAGATLGGSIGAAIASGLNLWDWVGWILIIALAILGLIIVWKIRDEAVIILTAIAGAGYVASGLRLMLGEGVIRSILWALIFIVLAVIGILWQWQRYRHLRVLGIGGPAAAPAAKVAAPAPTATRAATAVSTAPAAGAAAVGTAAVATAAVAAAAKSDAAVTADKTVDATKAAAVDVSGAAAVTAAAAVAKITPEERKAASDAHLDELLAPGAGRAGLAEPITNLKDLSPDQEAKLQGAGLALVVDILRRGATKQGRAELARTTGISEATLLSWVNFADLMRVKGVGAVYSRLLEAAGVDTAVELGQRNAANLHAKLVEVNAAQKLSGRDPRQEDVVEWVAQAKTLPRIIEY